MSRKYRCFHSGSPSCWDHLTRLQYPWVLLINWALLTTLNSYHNSYAVHQRVGVSHSQRGQSSFINGMPDNGPRIHIFRHPTCGSVLRQFFHSPVVVGFTPQHSGMYVHKSSSYIWRLLITMQWFSLCRWQEPLHKSSKSQLDGLGQVSLQFCAHRRVS
jgi:hypothetical protein